LFQAVIDRIGFRSQAHAARVLTVLPKREAARTHMVVTVQVNGETLVVDPGFGGHGALVPVPLVEGHDLREGADRHRFIRDEGEWVLQAEIEGRMSPLWTTTFEPLQTVDFAMANHFVCTFAESPFVNRLMLRALTPRGRTSVMNRDVTVVRDGTWEKYQLEDRKALRALLVEHFGFDLPEAERLRVPAVPEWR
jgi:N-hydroxyarylamine O-acetyltransferase